MEQNEKDLILSILRESLKDHRDMLQSIDDDTEMQALAHVLDSFILVSYNPAHLKDLTFMITKFLNSKLGGEN